MTIQWCRWVSQFVRPLSCQFAISYGFSRDTAQMVRIDECSTGRGREQAIDLREILLLWICQKSTDRLVMQHHLRSNPRVREQRELNG